MQPGAPQASRCLPTPPSNDGFRCLPSPPGPALKSLGLVLRLAAIMQHAESMLASGNRPELITNDTLGCSVSLVKLLAK